MKIDAHQHFWQFDPLRDNWITNEMMVIKRDFLPGDLKSILIENKMDGCVAVQASQSDEETEFLLNLSENHPFIKGVVGWVDLLGSDLEGRLEYYKNRKTFKGVRHILQAEPEGFMLDADFIRGISKLSKNGFSYDILINETQLQSTCKMISKLPKMHLVIDHIGKPNIRHKSFDHWAKYMKVLSEYDHVNVKLSGMVTEASWQGWTIDDLKIYVDFCLEHFGAERLMFGSDWPVCLLAGSYDQVYKALLSCIKELSNTEQSQILGGTAVDFYQLV